VNNSHGDCYLAPGRRHRTATLIPATLATTYRLNKRIREQNLAVNRWTCGNCCAE